MCSVGFSSIQHRWLWDRPAWRIPTERERRRKSTIKIISQDLQLGILGSELGHLLFQQLIWSPIVFKNKIKIIELRKIAIP